MSKNVLPNQYYYWRFRIFSAMYLGYVVYYFSRSSFKILDTFMIQDGLLTKQSHGFILAAFGVTYAISKFVGGMITDVSSPRFLMSMGIFLSGCINILISYSSNYNTFFFLWVINGACQGLGWPPVAKMLSNWYSKKERGSWWGFWSTSHNFGEFLMPLIPIFSYNWRLGMYIPGLIAVFTSFILYNRLRSAPEDVGLKNIDKYSADVYESQSFNVQEKTFWDTLVKHVFKNFYVWSLVFASVFIYFIRGAMSPWIVHVFLDNGYSYTQAFSMLSAFELGGFFGSFLSGWISDRFFNGKRSLVNIIFSVGITVTIYLMWLFIGIYSVEYFLIIMLGLFVYGPQMLLGVAVAEVSNKGAISTSTGFAGLWSYFGMSLAHICIPAMSFNSYFITLIFSGFLAILFFLPLLKFDYFKEGCS
jgi:OPA family sugar phosphate sensor protein UhpC-like MFS transporter